MIQPAAQLTVLSQTWGGGSDSYFEYLIKYARLSTTANNSFADTWLTAVDSSIRYLKRVSFFHPWLYPLTRYVD
jgi:mannosyl-oligosaccharide alpha-1,2-mannosidase